MSTTRVKMISQFDSGATPISRVFVTIIVSVLLFSDAVISVTVSEQKYQLTSSFAQARPWTWRISGLCGVSCRTLRRSSSAYDGSTLYVSGTRHLSWTPNLQYPDQNLYDEVTEGFVVAIRDGVLIDEVTLPYCNEMGEIFVSGGIVSTLCRSPLDPDSNLFPTQTYNFLNATDPNNTFFGWNQRMFSEPDVTEPKYRIVDNCYLLEWDGAAISAPPTSIVLVNGALGGWNYGSLSLVLLDGIYYIDVKTTITSEGDPGWHEGSVGLAMQRSDWTYSPSHFSSWGCGGGHVHLNRLIANKEEGSIARYCWTDGCYEDGRPASITEGCFGTYFDTLPRTSSNERASQLHYKPYPTEFSPWIGDGGPGSLISTSDGFLAVALQRDPATSMSLQVGIAKLPADNINCTEAAGSCEYKWLPSAVFPPAVENEYSPCNPGSDDKCPIGFANIAKFGSDRYLIGLASSVQFQGRSSSYFVFVIDDELNVYGNFTFIETGWGEDDAWTQGSDGCVTFPFARAGEDVGSPYGEMNSANFLSSTLVVTTICPSDVEESINYNYDDNNHTEEIATTRSSQGILIGVSAASFLAVLMLTVLFFRSRSDARFVASDSISGALEGLDNTPLSPIPLRRVVRVKDGGVASDEEGITMTPKKDESPLTRRSPRPKFTNV